MFVQKYSTRPSSRVLIRGRAVVDDLLRNEPEVINLPKPFSCENAYPDLHEERDEGEEEFVVFGYPVDRIECVRDRSEREGTTFLSALR